MRTSEISFGPLSAALKLLLAVAVEWAMSQMDRSLPSHSAPVLINVRCASNSYINIAVPRTNAISGVFDLSPLTQVSMNQDLRLDDAKARRVSPLHWQVPAGRTFDAVVGGIESSEFLRQSKIIADGWRARGVATRYEEIAGANHFTVVDPLSDANSAMTKRVAELAMRVNAMAL